MLTQCLYYWQTSIKKLELKQAEKLNVSMVNVTTLGQGHTKVKFPMCTTLCGSELRINQPLSYLATYGFYPVRMQSYVCNYLCEYGVCNVVLTLTISKL